MKRSDDLFQLIKSLDKAEKRFFRLYNGTYTKSGETTYLRLFSLLDKLPTYDEALFKKAHRGEKFIRHFAWEKNNLFNIITSSLVAFHETTTVDAEIRKLIGIAEVLHEKALLKQSYKTLQKAKSICRASGRFELLLVALNVEKKFVTNYNDIEQAGKIGAEINQTLQILENENFYIEYFTGIAHIIVSAKAIDKPTLAKLKKMMAHPMMKDPSSPKSLYATIQYHYIWDHYYSCLPGKHEKESHSGHIIRLFYENPSFTRYYLNEYLSVLASAFATSITTKNYTYAGELLAYIRKVKTDYGKLFNRIELYNYQTLSLLSEVVINVYAGQFKQNLKLQEQADLLPKPAIALKPQRYDSIKFYLAFSSFAVKQFGNCIQQLQSIIDEKILDEPKSYTRYRKAIFLRILSHLELKSYPVACNIARSYRKFLSGAGILLQSDLILLDWVITTYQKVRVGNIRESCRNLYEELKDVYKNDIGHSGIEEFSHIILAWLRKNFEHAEFADCWIAEWQ